MGGFMKRLHTYAALYQRRLAIRNNDMNTVKSTLALSAAAALVLGSVLPVFADTSLKTSATNVVTAIAQGYGITAGTGASTSAGVSGNTSAGTNVNTDVD